MTATRLEMPAVHQLAIDAAVWGTPIVSFDAMRQAFFRDACARYGDVVYFSRAADWRLQITTPNAATRYAYLNFNTKDGPLVMEIPPAVGAGLFGSILDAWQVPLVDVGGAGADRGMGGRYLLLPPGYIEDVPGDHILVPSATYNGYAVLRAISEDSSKAAVDRALGLIKQIRVYPLAQAEQRPHTRAIDMAGKLFDGMMRFSESFYASLARMVNEEPTLARDADMLERLKDIGIEKGRHFAPDAALRRELKAAAQETLAHFVAQQPYEGEMFLPASSWRTPTILGAKTGFSFTAGGKLDVEARAQTFFMGCAPPRRLGKASMYLAAYVDSENRRLSGNHSYQLRLPPNPPAQQFWALTVYDAISCGFLRESPKVEVNSYHEALRLREDGSADIYAGVAAPAGKSGNWVALTPGHQWFALLRFYGPSPALFNKNWRPPDFVRVS